MEPTIYWIESVGAGRLGITARPRGGEWLAEELRGLRAAGVDTVVSLLTPAETGELGLAEEARLCAAAGIRFLNLPIGDRQVPESMAAARLIQQRHADLLDGQQVVRHCRSGIGRAMLIATSVLVAAGVPPGEALRRTETARGRPIPDTEEQAAWVERFARYQSLQP